MKTSTRVTLYTALLVGGMSAALIGLIYYEVSRSFYKHIQQQQDVNMKVAHEQLDRLGKPLRVVGAKMLAGETVLNGDQVMVDRVTSLVGGIATIFLGDTRIATNIRLPDGSRAVGTKLTGPAREAIFDRGQSFRGETKTLGESYLSVYELLRNEKGAVIGILQVGVLKKAYSGDLNSILLRSFFIVFLGMVAVGLLVHGALGHLTHQLEMIGQSSKVLLRSTFSGVFGVDAEGRCTFINQVGAKFLGGTFEDFVGKDIHSLIHHGPLGGMVLAAADCPLCQVFKSGKTYHNEDDVLWRLDQKILPVDIQSFPLMENNRISGAIVAFNDITNRKRIALELEELNKKRESARFGPFIPAGPANDG